MSVFCQVDKFSNGWLYNITIIVTKYFENGKLVLMCYNNYRVTKDSPSESRVRDHVVHLGINVNSSAHKSLC